MNSGNEKGPFDVIKNPSRIELAKTGAKLESGTSLLWNTSIAMGHTHIKYLPDSQFLSLSVPAPISYYKHYCRTHYLTLHGHMLNILWFILWNNILREILWELSRQNFEMNLCWSSSHYCIEILKLFTLRECWLQLFWFFLHMQASHNFLMWFIW